MTSNRSTPPALRSGCRTFLKITTIGLVLILLAFAALMMVSVLLWPDYPAD